MNNKLQRIIQRIIQRIRRSICKNYVQPIRVGNDGCWVHEDPDEDPTNFDYGWAQCLPQNEDDFENYAEPNH